MIEYDEKQHRYIIDGTEVPSVTRIIKYEGLWKFVNPKAKDNGKALHKVIEARLRYGLIAEGYEDIVDSYISELTKVQKIYGDIVAIEQPLAGQLNGMLFAGTPDIILEKAIVDIKSTIANIKYYELQLYAYSLLAEQNGLGAKKKQLILIGKKGQNIKAINCTSDNKIVAKIFKKLLEKWYIEYLYHNYINSK